jgi:protease-4
MKKVLWTLAGLILFLLLIAAGLASFSRVSVGEKIALLRVEGTITDTYDSIESLKEYVKDPSIKAIVIRVDSPGGAVAPSQELYKEIKKAAEKKKVVISMGSVAASGGYYISVAGTRIVADPGTLTGSIGVIMEIPNVQGLMNKIGVKTEVIKAGKHKDLASMFKKMGPEERAILQGVLDDVHEQFINAVADGRKLPVEKVREIADGRVFTGRQALAIGLVDELGGLEDAIKTAKSLAGIKGEATIVKKKKGIGLFDFLREQASLKLPDISPSVKIKYIFSP